MATKSSDKASPSGPCGIRFAQMLRCVEVSGSSAACTREIDAFLTCERAVFQALKRGGGAASVPSENIRSPRLPPHAPSRARAPDPPRDEPITFRDRANAAYEAVSHAAGRQATACRKLTDMCVQEGMANKLKQRCTGIVEEGFTAVSLVSRALARGMGNMASEARRKFDERRRGSSEED